MLLDRYRPILRALNDADVRYVVAGGWAVIAHGYVRFTGDLDLIIDLEPDAALKAMQVLTEAGLKPKVPEPAERFADPEVRRNWIETKNMIVFQFWHPDDSYCVVDVFVSHPIAFGELWAASQTEELDGEAFRVVGYKHLVELKRLASRPKDLLDLQQLAVARGEDDD